MLIGGDDISNDTITLGTCFLMFVHICAHFHFMLIGRNLTAHAVKGEPQGEFKFLRLSFLFPPHCQSAPESLLAG